MIWQLAKRESAWTEMYGYIPLVAIMSAATPRFAPPLFAFLIGLSWLRSRPAERASLFQAALPVAATDLYLSRLLAHFTLIWVPAAAGIAGALLAGHGWPLAATLLETAAALSVLVLAGLSNRVRELAGSWWTPPIAMCTVWVAGEFLVDTAAPAVALAICTAVCAVLFAATWMRLPLSFEVSSQSGASSPAYVPAVLPVHRLEAGVSQGAPLFQHWRPILRSAFPWTAWLFLPIIMMQNLGGQWSYASSQALFPMLMALPRLAWAQALPIRRGVLLTLLIAPWFLTLALNLAAGGLLLPAHTPIHYDYMADKLGSIRPPLEFWRIAPDGKAPVIESPWHETWRPPIQTVAGVAIYNPYSLGALNTRRFLEWQYRRATLAIYGQEVAFNDYHSPTLRPLEQRPRFIVLNVAACLCWLLLLVNAVFLAMHWRTAVYFSHGAKLAGFLVLLPMMVPFVLDVLVKSPFNSVGTSLMNALLFRILALLPGGVLPVLALSALPVGLLSWSALRLFAGVEPLPPDPTIRA